ncbi:defect-in-organelle-trafficking protein DotD [Neisseria sp. HSC-16F19]|nr:DotD/TraH family lipoprotein [Neisseria sp. HSC-16F19]MCP2041876.1 defect-in-organelle-trafficking protein DotD [Neisseria sp. HSC-16F19]
MKKRLYVALTALAALTACQSTGHTGDAAMAQTVIAQKISVAADAQMDYTEMLNEDTRLRYQRQDDFQSELIDVDYIGKPIPMLNAMANRYGFSLVETGKRKDLRIVNVRMKSVAPVEVMRSLAQQMDYAADIVLDKQTSTIRVVYK